MFTSALIRERIAREFTQQPAAAPSWSLRPVGGRDMAVSTEILVVDDELDLREMVAEYLARHGFHVRTAMDGEAMTARLQEKNRRCRDPRHQHARRGRADPCPPSARAQRCLHHDADRRR